VKSTLVAAAAVMVHALVTINTTLKLVVSAAVADPVASRVANAKAHGERVRDRMKTSLIQHPDGQYALLLRVQLFPAVAA